MSLRRILLLHFFISSGSIFIYPVYLLFLNISFLFRYALYFALTLIAFLFNVFSPEYLVAYRKTYKEQKH